MAEHGDADLRQGAKAAAAAAAVGAAVGVARAIATRAEHAAHHEDGRPEQEEQPEEQRAEQRDEQRAEQPEGEERTPVRGEGAERLRRVTDAARTLLQELSGAEIEAVSALDRTADGWRVTVETVEVRRIPDSTDVLATYEVQLDGDCDLVRYERLRRYSRAQSDRGDER